MEPNSFTPFDNMTQTRELQMLKTAIPYMKGDQKKQFAILIKYMELQNTIQVFNQEDKVMSMCSVSQNTENAEKQNPDKAVLRKEYIHHGKRNHF